MNEIENYERLIDDLRLRIEYLSHGGPEEENYVNFLEIEKNKYEEILNNLKNEQL